MLPSELAKDGSLQTFFANQLTGINTSSIPIAATPDIVKQGYHRAKLTGFIKIYFNHQDFLSNSQDVKRVLIQRKYPPVTVYDAINHAAKLNQGKQTKPQTFKYIPG